VLHHAKFDALVLWGAGIELRGIIFDTYIAAQLVTMDWQRSSLKTLSAFFLQEEMLTYEDMVTLHKYKNFSQVPLEKATIYAATDARQTLKLIAAMQVELKNYELESVYYDIELPLLSVLIAMETYGILCDTQVLEKINKEVTQAIIAIEEKIGALLGKKE